MPVELTERTKLLENLFRYKPRYFPFPSHPGIVSVEGYSAYDYITPLDTNELIDNFCPFIDLSLFDAILINKEGGGPFAYDLIAKKGSTTRVEYIEYHEDGRIVTPVPQYLRGAFTLTVDDVLDLGITGNLIITDAKDTIPLYLTRKRGVPGQKTVRNAVWLSETDRKWFLGKGMNGDEKDDGYPLNWGRTYRGIAVKIPKQ